ncbi:sugar ABC transporter substrate-binding protein [Actinoallomurus liliacearum]|uniref:Sugar ABC transporter substrate-binding protein n=1 Tax=Actinoallomurus liliacearum TaxID=1080073 RepID=A0ABP8TS99_9ACTN
MFETGRRAGILLAGLALALTACSSHGGKKAQESANDTGAGKANTPRMKIAMVTHQPPGDTFWDIVRKGAEAAAAKDNVQLVYSNDPDGDKQATLVQNAIDSKVDGIAVTLSHPDAMAGTVKKASGGGIPVVVLNAGMDDWQKVGALEFFGSDESLAGESAGKRLSTEGAKHVLCVLHEQGSVSLEARCGGLAKTFSGKTDKVYVQGTNMPSVRSTIAAKLKQDKSIDRVVALGAPFALTALQSVKDAGSPAKVAAFDMNPAMVKAVQDGTVEWAVDQQPYLQGYLAVDSLWLYKTNGNVLGGGQATPTGPYFVDKNNVAAVAQYASRGTR